MKKIDKHGKIKYYNENNQLHRTDGPAVEDSDGTKEWYINGKRHRIDGPAIECTYGIKYWYKNGQLHRTDGPAVEYINVYKEWYINGKELTELEFNLSQYQSTNDFSEGF